MIREVVQKHKLNAGDLLYRIGKKLNDPSLTFKSFKEAMLKLDTSFSKDMIKQLFDQLAPKRSTSHEPTLAVGALLQALTSGSAPSITMADYFKAHPDQLSLFRQFLQAADTKFDGILSRD